MDYGYYRKCKTCKKRRRHKDLSARQCNMCDQQSLNGNKIIDNWLVKTTGISVSRHSFMEFIPYERFNDIIYISEGGFSKIYKATCVNGIRDKWNGHKQRFEYIQNAKVVLKSLNNSEAISHDFLNELKNYFQCFDHYVSIIQYYGITQHPETKDYMIVIDFAKNGDLYNFISKNFLAMSWKQKLGTLRDIARGLRTMHSKKIIHRDLHSGNILIGKVINDFNLNPNIGDFGISKPANEITDTKEIYGVIPYIAPEIFNGEKYTTASDIYSFGMIMWEMITGQKPFSDRNHDEYLILDILNGLHPEIINDLPQPYIDLMKKCWDANPLNRPSAGDIAKTIQVIINAGRKGINFPENIIHTHIKKMNPQAIYTSRYLSSLVNTALRMKLNYNTLTNYSILSSIYSINNIETEDPFNFIEDKENNEIKTSTQNKQLSKMDLSFLCSSKRTLYYYQQESEPLSHPNLNIPKKHHLYENNLVYNDIHSKNKRQKNNEDTQYQDNHNYQSKEFEFDINR